MGRMNIFLTKERDDKLNRLKNTFEIKSKEEVINRLIDKFEENNSNEFDIEKETNIGIF